MLPMLILYKLRILALDGNQRAKNGGMKFSDICSKTVVFVATTSEDGFHE